MQRPIFCIFKELSLTANQSDERDILTQLLNQIYIKQPRVAYYFLYYINALNMRLQLNNLEKNAQIPVQNELSTLIRIYKEFAQERHDTEQQQQQEQRRQEQSQDTMSAMAAAKADVNVKLISDSSSENSESAASPSTSSSSGAIGQ
jgi:hypothetical protein